MTGKTKDNDLIHANAVMNYFTTEGTEDAEVIIISELEV